ncbi:MAG: hypothetical protein M3R17_19870 [Bacteroidota bacterium]|nr:hypothetical protein [Bacteroidota bacterium]
MKNILLPAIVIGLLFASCNHEDPFEREQKEMDEALSSSQLQAYKSFKVAMRGTAATGQDSAFDQARREVLSAMAYSLAAATDSTTKIDLVSALRTSTTLLSSVALLAKKDEDSLATVLENFAFVMNSGKTIANDPFAGFLNESEEHAVLGALWMGTPSAPGGLSLYEIQKVKDGELRSIDVQVIAKMARSMMYFQRKWPYHAERSADELVTLIEKEKDYFRKNPWPAVDANGDPVSVEQSWRQLHATSVLMRALARMQMENKDKEYMDDLSLFVAEAESGGFDDEAVWSIGALVAIKKDDKTMALKYLDKLEKSKNLSADELSAIAEIKKYLEEKENDEALSAMKDKIAFGRITASYFGKLLMNSKPVNELNKSEGGKRFLAITDLSFGDAVSAAENTVDSAVEGSKNVIKDLFK